MMKKTVYLFSILLGLAFIGCNEVSNNIDKKEVETLTEVDNVELENSKSIEEAGDNITKAYVYLNDSLFHLRAKHTL